MKTKSKAAVERDVYFDLVREFPLKPIRTAAQNDAALKVCRRLMLKPEGCKRPVGEGDYLDVLTGLIEAYEQKAFPLKPTSPLQRLKFIIDESGTTQAEFRQIIGLSQPAASLILSGKRSLTVDAIRRLADHFKLSAAYFV